MFYSFAKTIVRIFLAIVFSMKYEGLENIPKKGGFIVCGNHRTNFDPPFCVVRIKQKMNFMAKEELFKNRFIGGLLKALGAFPITRGTEDSGAVDNAKDIIAHGGNLLMFPEGTRSKDGYPKRPRSGVAVIAGHTGADILPCSIDYGKKLGFRKRVTVKYHPAISSEDLNVDFASPKSVRDASRRIMDTIVSGLTVLKVEEAK